MQIVTTFDPSANATGTFNLQFPNGVGRFIVINESNVNLTLSYNGNSAYVPAWDARLFSIAAGNNTVTWTQQSTLISQTPPISQVAIETYDPDEEIIEGYPAALVRQTNSGNQLQLNTQATFQVKHNVFTTGNKGSVSIIPGASQMAYITGFCVSASPGGAGIAYNLQIAGINLVSNPNFWIESTTTGGCFEFVPFPYAQPAISAGTQITLSLLTNSNATVSLVIFGYYQ